MKKIMTLVLMAFLPCCEKSSPDSEAVTTEVLTAEHELVLSEQFVVEKYTVDLKGWLQSLYKGLGYDKGDTEEEIFLRCDLRVRSPNRSYTVFQSTKNNERFYVQNLGYVVDFQSQEVGTLGVGGISAHFPPSNRMVVLLCPSKGQEFMGVPLGDLKTDSPKPKFTDNIVRFQAREITRKP